LHGEIDVRQDWHTSTELDYSVYIYRCSTRTRISV
jgi:hypothetical protein